ncbi:MULTISPECIES: hemagglutinin repeat-containing protein [Rhizobium]|uniref:Filamentous hemagglutinin n=2 Tax=Rhizobium tropici TaxID=398 RepID=A0A6P1C6Y3_RHITR|nr:MULTISPECIES: hemagglutinin repeat-containing protein [Rhizobium]AGB73036.1 filamentous hemagglutinin-like T5SS secreted protein [Rhizobium tropici CIAT 899]MBB4244328.1 filamentous hemagglutinin [Rhizobium tropici]MBB5595431.1 filamentous hemagglutinin [Rhizobium tropici]MBB6494667.1 filamentous hemagglutinin [Rhizobium tropici]NEV12818.1 filamentous hemagglutinin N-terminal domain-containing protein [Rhizobium tropici]
MRQLSATLLSALLVFQPMLANAQSVSAAGSAPAANQPGVGSAPNGVPLIDIVTPNATGLSHNKYDNFNVGTQGLILNNFKGEVGTSNLGGATPGNPNLNGSGPASVILNEVTSGNRSALNGPTEVYGGRADVIIANPNGITCAGCGFINTPRATLTTGVPNIGSDGSLTGFTVNGGDVTFEGAGGNFAAAPGAVDLFDVVSRQIHVNAPIYGKTVRLTGGASQYNYATGEATALTATSGTPEYAIDGTALGAMQADRIKVVVTEKGAGVRMSGDMAANAGELSLSADGKISIGNASARDGVTITSKQKVAATKVTSRQKVAIRADQGITLQSVAADSDIVLANGAGLLSVSGDVNSGATVQMSSGGGIAVGSVTAGNGAATLSAASGDIAIAGGASSTGDLTLTAAAGSISAASLLSYNNLALTAGNSLAVSGNVLAQGNVNATARSISTGMVVSGINIAATSADPGGNVILGSAGNLSLTATGGNIATGNLQSAGSLNTSATGNITAGNIQSAGNLTAIATSLTAANVTSHGGLTVNAAMNASGQILGAGNILISGAGIQATAIASGVDFASTKAAGGNIVLGSAGALDLTAAAGTITVGTLLSAGNLTAQASLLQSDNLTSHGNVGIDGGMRVTNQLLGASDITINGNANGVSAGLLASGVNFAATKASGGNIVLAGSGDLTINDSAGAIQVGTVLSAGAINAAGQTITADAITGGKDITLTGATSPTAGSGSVATTTTSGRVEISGQVLGGGNVGITGSSIAADAIVSGVDIAATNAAGGRITLAPTITGTGNLTLTSAGAISAGTLLSAGDLIANGASITSGNISAHHDMTLGGVVSVSGQILGAGNVLISGQNLSAQTLVAGIDFNATNAAGGNITLGASGDLKVSVNGAVTTPTIQAAGVFDVSGASVTADSIIGHENITLAGTTTVHNQLLGGSNVSVSGPSIKAGSIVSGVDFARTAGANGNIVLASTGDLTLAAANALNVGSLLSAGSLGAVASSLTANSVTAHGDMRLGGAINVTQQILGSGNVLISGQSLSTQTVVAGIDFGATNTAGGNIVLGQAGDLKVTVNGAVTAPTMQAAGVIDVSGSSIAADGITGHKNITLSGATAVNNQVLGGSKVAISGPTIKAGAIISGVDFAATAAANGHIVQTASGDLTLGSSGAIDAGTVLAASDLIANGATIRAGNISAHHDMTLGGVISVSGQILGAGNVSINGPSLSAQSLVAGLDFNATDAGGGNVVLGQTGDLKVVASDFVTVPTVQAAGTIDIHAATVTSDAITGHKDITVSAVSGPVNVTNQVLGGGKISLAGSAIKASGIVSGIDFTRTAAANGHIVQTASGDISLTSPGAISVGTLLSAGNLNAFGSTVTADGITAHGDVTLGGAISVTDQILGSGNVSISGQSLSAQTVVAGIDFDATNRAGGNIVLGQSGNLAISVGGTVAAPTVQAAGSINAGGATINANAVTSHGNITLSGSTTVTSQVLGGGSIAISGPGIKVGTVVSGVDFARTAAANGNIVQTASGDLTLTSTGSINAGTLLAAGAFSANGITVNADTVTAHGDIMLKGTGTMTSAGVNIAGQILGSGNVLISGQSLSAQTVIAGIDFDATNRVGGNIVLGQSGDLTVNVNGAVTAPTIQAAGSIDISGASVTAASITGHKDISLSGTAVGGVNVANQVLGGDSIGISGPSVQVGTIVSGVDFAATSANGGNIVQTASGDISLTSSGNISGGTLLSAGNLNASGLTVGADSVTAHGAVTLNGAVSVTNQILGSGNVSITGQSLSAQTIVSGIDFDATNAAGGNIVLGQRGDVTVNVNGAVAAPTIQAAGAVDLSGTSVAAASITGHKDVALSGTAVGGVTVANQLLAGGNIGISGSSIKAGAIVSGVDFAATAAANGNIVQTTSGNLTLASTGGINTGTLLSAGNFSASGTAVTADAVTAHGDVTLNGTTSVTGQVLGAGNILITGQSLSAQSVVAGIDFAATNASGGNIVLGRGGFLTAELNDGLSASTMQAGGAINVNAATVTADTVTGHKDIALAGATTVHGQILGGGNISISGPSIAAGAIVSGVDFTRTAAANGNIVQTSSGDMSLASSGNLTIGTLLSAGNVTAQASNLSANSITSHGTIDLAANGLVNVSGQVLSAGNLSIDGASLNAGLLVSGVDFTATAANGGNIVLGGAGKTDLTVSGNATAGTILSAGDITAKTANLQAGSVTSHGNVGIIGNVDVSNQILAAGDLTINGGSISAPTLISGIDFAATNAAGGNIVLASSGSTNLTASGNLTAGTILSAGGFMANAADVIADSITAHGNAGIVGNVDISNQIIAAGNLTVSGGHINAPTLISGIDFAATNAHGGGIVLGTAGDLNLTASAGLTAPTMLSAGAINASGSAIVANAVTGHGDITLAGSSNVNVTGQLLSAGDVLLSGSTVQLGQAVTGVDFATTARSSNGAIALGSSGDLTINAVSASAGTLIVAGNLNVAASAFTGGNITGHGAVAIGSSTRPGTVRISGQLLGASNVSVTGSGVSGNVIAAGVDFAAMDQSGAGNVILGQGGNLTLASTAGDISFNSLLAAGTIAANAANNIGANAVAHGDLSLTAGNAITLNGQSLGTGNINLNARSISIDTLVSGVDFAATNASSNRSLMLRRAGTMTLAASSGSISANSLLSGGNLSATATQNISYNSLQSLGNAALASPGAIAYTNTTRVGGSLTLNTGALDLSGSRGSRIAAGGTLIVNASSANLSGSNLVFGGLSLNLSGGADLSNAQVSTVANAGGSGDITISAAGLATTAGTSLLAAHDLTLNLPSLGNTGQLAAGNNLAFNVAGDFYNSPSGLVFAGNNANLFVGGTLTNDQGAILSGNGLAIAGPGGGQRNGAVVNSAGLIQSGGSMSILTNGLSNVTTSAPAIQRNVQISNAILSAYDVITRTYRCATRCNGSGDHDPPTYTWVQAVDHLVSQIVSQDQLISGAGASAQIRAGGDLTVNAINLWNGYSSIKSDGNMLLTVAGTLTNDGATLNRVTQTICDSSTPCQYYPDVVSSDPTQGGQDCSGPNRPCIGGNDPTLDYTPNPNGRRDPSRDLNPGTTVNVQVIGAISGVIQARGALAINGGGAVNNVASNGSIAGQVAIDAPATANNPLGALNSMTAGGALFNVSAALSNVAANGGANAGSGPALTGSGPTIGSGPAVGNSNLRASGGTSINNGTLTANSDVAVSNRRVTATDGPLVGGGNMAVANGVAVSSTAVTTTAGTSIGNTGVTAAAGPAISGNTLTAAGASVSPNSLMGKLTAAIGNSGNLTQILQTNGTQLASLAKPQSGGVGGTVPGQVFLFETRAAFLDVSKFYGSAYFIDRVGYTPETKVPFLGDAYFDNQLIDEQMRQLVGNGLGAGSFVPGDNATDQMKSLLDNGVAYAEANGLGLGQALTPQQAASLTQSMVIYQTEIVDGAPVLVPVVYLSAADRAKTTSAAMIAGNTVSIDAASVDNSGAIAAADGMTINAGSIKANGGAFLAGGNMNLNAENGITLAAQTMNIGGQTMVAANGGVTAGGNLKMDAGAGSLTLSGTKVAAGGSAQLSGQTVTVGAVKQDNGGVQTLVGTTVTTGGNLSIAGTNGVNIIASSAKVGGDLSVSSSNGSVSIISAGVDNTVLGKDRLNLSQGGTITTTTSQIQQGSSLIAGGAMLVSGSQGVLIGGSSLDAGGNLGIVSTNGNIAITASQDQTASQSKTIAGAANGYKGGQSSSTAVTSNASSITSQNGGITVEADQGNISVIGSRVDAAGSSTNLIAKGDVTIGEATDTASSSSSSGKQKSSETTITVQGSSIAGLTGVNVISSGGNVTISASNVTAGDETHKANANVQADGNIIIASGKDTKETTSDSKSSGFLSSKKTHTHSYDENNVGSSISASGDINVSAGGEAVVSGSNMAAGGNLALSGSTVTVMGAEESHESDSQVKKSGIGVGSGGGFISIYGSKDQKSSQSSTDNIGSTLNSGGSTSITSTKGDVNIFGSSSHSGTGTAISSARDVNIAPGAEEQSSSSQTKRSGFGINFASNSGSLSIGIGVGTSEEKRSKDANINAVTTLESDASITIAANRNINDQSGQILAAGPISLIAGDNVQLLSSNDVTNASEMQKKSFAGISLTVQSSLIAAGQQAAQAGSLLSSDNSAYGIAPAVLAGYNGYKALQQTYPAATAAPDPKTGLRPPVAGISLTAGYSFSESSSQSTTSIPVPPSIRGSSVSIVAESGDVIGRGVQISAGLGKDGRTPVASDDPRNGNVLISAAGNVDLESVQGTSDSKSSSKAGSVGIGVAAGVDIGGNLIGGGPTASASFNSGKSNGTSVTQVNSNIVGTNVVTVNAGDTLKVAGGVLSGNTVDVSAANGIVIESRQDTASYNEKSRGAALGIGPGSGGLTGGYNQGTVTGDYANVTQQSGIFAGSGGYHVSTNGTIDLKGGFIGSTAAPADNMLNANQILYSDIGNSMSASSTSYGFALQGGIPVPVVGQPTKQGDYGATLATITPGTWNLTGQSQDLASLNTDASKANNQVEPFDIDKLKAQQQSAAALSILLNTGVGELSQRLGFDEGSPEKVALHAAVGAIVSKLAGTNIGAGALGGAASEIANGVLQQVLQADSNLSDNQKSVITQWVAAAVGAAVGGATGAAAALDNINYNYLTHKDVEDARKKIEAVCAQAGAGSAACTAAKETAAADLGRLNADQNNRLMACRDPACVEAIKKEIIDSKQYFQEDYATLLGIDENAARILLYSQNDAEHTLQNAEVIGNYCASNPGGSCVSIAIGLKLAQQAAQDLVYGKIGAVGARTPGGALADDVLGSTEGKALPADYTRNTDGTITGPGGGIYRIAGSDLDGQIVYKDSGGRYYTFDGVKTDASNPAGRPDVSITQQRAYHQGYVDDVTDQLRTQGYDVQNDVTFQSSCGTSTCKPDIVYRRPGQTQVGGIIEIKTGDAQNTTNQAAIYPQISNGDAVPSGPIAEKLGLEPGVPLRDQGYPNGIPIYQITAPGL